VISTYRDFDGGFYRRRACQDCDCRFQTAQLAEIIAPSYAFSWTIPNVKINWHLPELSSRIQELITLHRR
jgi:hypothetical protein